MEGRLVQGAARVFSEGLWRQKISAHGPQEVGKESRECLAAPLISACARILDVGCGIGSLFEVLASPALAVGVDVAWSALEVAKRHGHAVVRMDLDGPRLPFPDASFDCVACLAVVEHLFDPRVMVGEVHCVLVAGGCLLVLVPNVRYHYRVDDLLVHGRIPRTSGDPEGIDGGHLHYFTFSDLRALLESAGFADVRLRGTNGIRFLPSLRPLDIFAIARKPTSGIGSS